MSPIPFGRAIAVAVAVLLLAAACGTSNNAGSDTAVATLDDGSTNDADDRPAGEGEADALEAPENTEDAFALYDACMSAAGFDFETAGSGTGGAVSVETPGGGPGDDESDPQDSAQSPDDFDFEAFNEADDKCSAHLRNIDGGFDLTPEQVVALEDAELAWARCMAEQGVDLPEFELGGESDIIAIEGADVDGDPQGGLDLDDPDFDFSALDEAAEACGYVYDEFDELVGAPSEKDQ